MPQGIFQMQRALPDISLSSLEPNPNPNSSSSPKPDRNPNPIFYINLSSCYPNPNPSNSQHHLQAVAHGYADSENSLGEMLYAGDGVKQVGAHP